MFGKNWFTWKGFKRTIKDEITGRSRPLKPGELPEYREFTCQTGQKKYVKGIGAKYDARAHSLIRVNLVNEADRKAENSFGNINVPGTVEIVGEGFTYHIDNDFEPVPTHIYQQKSGT